MMEQELYHWGIHGMRWGKRRYQYEDGTLTPEGKIRYRKDGTERPKSEQKLMRQRYETLKKARAAKLKKAQEAAKKAQEEAKRPKTVKDLSDEDLRKQVERLKLENSYFTNKDFVDKHMPDTRSAGKKFIDKVVKDIAVPAATEAGKQLLTNYLKSQGDKLIKELNKN